MSSIKSYAKAPLWILLSVAVAVLNAWLYFGVFHLESPKTILLRRTNEQWRARVSVINRDLDRYEEVLDGLEMRGDDVYRSIFGMNPIPSETLGEGLIGAEDYPALDRLRDDSDLKRTIMRLDEMTRRTYMQSKSFDDVSNMSKKAGDMASCRPAIPPVSPRHASVRLSSSFGRRVDPVYGGVRSHEGQDFACKTGTPIYATGDGVVDLVRTRFYGYGNIVEIDHGFGYKTRYAHMQSSTVTEGMHISRGSCIGTVGSTGKSTGSHLHYEVLYKDRPVNPVNFYDWDMSVAEYDDMINKVDKGSQAILDPNFRYRP